MVVLEGTGMGWKSDLEDDTEKLVMERKKGRKFRVLGKNQAKMLMVGAGARVLFYPTLLYNLVRNRLQPEFRWWDEIDQFLVLGAVPFPGDVLRLKNVGVHAVVTLNESYETLVHPSLYKDHGIDHLVIPTRDYLFAPSLTDISTAVKFIHEHALLGKRTYVHCKAGRGRSTTVVICYLMEYRGMSSVEAWQYVRARRPRVLLASAQWQAVQSYSSQCNSVSQCKLRELTPCYSLPAPPLVLEDGDDDTWELPVFQDDGDISSLPVIVSKSDLSGYRSIADAGIVGNDMWKDIGLIYRLRLLASRNVKASFAWSRLSRLWISSSGRNLARTSERGSGSETGSCKKMASSGFTSVPVCQSGLVN